MKTVLFKNVVLSAVAISLGALTGCESTGTQESRRDSEVSPSRPVATTKAESTQREPASTALSAPIPAPAASPATIGWWPTKRTNDSIVWSSMAFPTGVAETSVVGIEKGYPTEARLNQDFVYKVLVTNLTRNTLENVVLSEDFGKDLKYYSSVPAGAPAGTKVSWMIGSLRPRETATIAVSAVPTAQGSAGACSSVSYASALCASVPVVSPELRVVETAPTEIIRCDELLYTIVVSNVGTGSITGVRVVGALPRGVETIDGQSNIEIAVGTLAAGEIKRYVVQTKANAKGKYENTVTATGDGDLKAESTPVSTMVREPALTITKTGPKEMYISVPFTYEIVVTSVGDALAADTVLEDPMPKGAEVLDASTGGTAVDGKVIWKLGDLAPGASRKVTVTLRGDTPSTVGSLATAKASCAEAVTAGAETVLRGIPAALLEVVDLTDPIRVGDNVTYRITVTNQGSAVDKNIKVVCTLEENQQFVSARGATTGAVTGNTIELRPLPSLAPKEQAVWTITVRNVKAGDVRFKVAMTSENLTRSVEETESTTVWE